MPKIWPAPESLLKSPNVVQESFWEEIISQLPLDLSDELTQTLRHAVDSYTSGGDREFVRTLIVHSLSLLDAHA